MRLWKSGAVVVVCLFVVLVGCLNSVALADYTVSGKFQYEDRAFNQNGFTGAIDPRPIRFADVSILAGDTVLAKGATNADGVFTITVPGSTNQAIRAVCYASSTMTTALLMEVRYAYSDYSFGGIYSVSSRVVSYSGGDTLSMGTTTAPANDYSGGAFNIWDVAYDGMEFVASPDVHGSFPTKKITLIWSPDHSLRSSFYSGGTNNYAFIGSRSGYDDTVIAHEFGRFVADAFSLMDSPLQLSAFGDGNQDVRLAWSDGVGMFIGRQHPAVQTLCPARPVCPHRRHQRAPHTGDRIARQHLSPAKHQRERQHAGGVRRPVGHHGRPRHGRRHTGRG